MSIEGLRRQAASSHLYPVKGGGVVFDPEGRRLFALNPSAAYVWLCLSQGLGDAETIDAFASAFASERPTAVQAVEQAISTFELMVGSVETLPPLGLASPSVPWKPDGETTIYHFLDSHFAITAPPDIAVDIDALLPGKRVDTQAAVSIALAVSVNPAGEGFRIRAGQEDLLVGSQSMVLAEVERLLVQNAVRSTPHWLTFHAACLSKTGHAILVSGPSGSGKTTLSAVLAKRGWSYGSDELTMLGPGKTWRPVPIPPCIKSQNFTTIQKWYPELAIAPAHKRYGNTVKYLPLGSVDRRTKVHTVVFPTYDKSRSGGLTAIEPLEGLSRLLGQCVYMADEFDRVAVEQLIAWHDTVSYVALVFNDADTAADTLTCLFGQDC